MGEQRNKENIYMIFLHVRVNFPLMKEKISNIQPRNAFSELNSNANCSQTDFLPICPQNTNSYSNKTTFCHHKSLNKVWKQ